jgi:hypothetical protein
MLQLTHDPEKTEHRRSTECRTMPANALPDQSSVTSGGLLVPLKITANHPAINTVTLAGAGTGRTPHCDDLNTAAEMGCGAAKSAAQPFCTIAGCGKALAYCMAAKSDAVHKFRRTKGRFILPLYSTFEQISGFLLLLKETGSAAKP